MLHGVDVSSYQSSDYAISGLSFVFIKLTEGLSYVNPKWTAQRTRARKAGLVTGFYHYPHMANSPTAEADHFLAQIRLAPGDILCLDWEWYGQNVSDARARSYKETWLKHVKSKAPSHRVVLYCDRSNWLNVDTDSYCGDGLWIADLTTAGHPRVKHHWTFHQYSETGTDKDVANFASAASLHSWAGVAKRATDPTDTGGTTDGPGGNGTTVPVTTGTGTGTGNGTTLPTPTSPRDPAPAPAPAPTAAGAPPSDPDPDPKDATGSPTEPIATRAGDDSMG